MNIQEYGKIATDKDLNPEAVRLLSLIYKKLDENPNYILTRKDMEVEWCNVMGRVSQRRFCRGWNNLKDTYYIIFHRDSMNKFFTYWELKSYAESMRLRKQNNHNDNGSNGGGNQDNNSHHTMQNVKDTQKTVQTNKTNIKTNILSLVSFGNIESSVKYIFKAYVNKETDKRVYINGKKIGIKAIRGRFQEAIEKGIVDKVIARVIKKIKQYSGTIKSLTSYIVASLYNTVQEWQEWEERTAAETKKDKEKEAESSSAPMSATTKQRTNKATLYSNSSTSNKHKTKFHNFEERNTDYDSLLRQFNPSYKVATQQTTNQALIDRAKEKTHLSEIDKLILGIL